MAEPPNLRASGERIEQALIELEASADARTLARAHELLRLVSELYGAGLARMVEITRANAPGIIAEYVADDLVASLLLVQGLHPESLDVRIEGALAKVRPLLGRHGGDVELLAIDDELGAVKLRLLGSCDGCPSSAATLRGAVEVAIIEAAPEVQRIVLEDSEGGAPLIRGEVTEERSTTSVPIALGSKPRFDSCPTEVGVP